MARRRRTLTRRLATLAALLLAFTAAPVADASVGINVSPGWGDTVDGKNITGMKARILDLRPHTLRMPWVGPENPSQPKLLDTIRWARANGIDTLVHTSIAINPELQVQQMVSSGVPITAVEGPNEPDVPDTGYTPTPVPLSGAKKVQIADFQTRLFNAVAGRWPVLCSAAVYRVNEPFLLSLSCNIANAHLYGSRPGPPVTSDAALPQAAKPVWVTETGYPTYREPFGAWVISEEMQRNGLVAMRDMLTANGAARVLVYKLSDDGPRSLFATRVNNNWGLYQYGGTPKLAAVALR